MKKRLFIIIVLQSFILTTLTGQTLTEKDISALARYKKALKDSLITQSDYDKLKSSLFDQKHIENNVKFYCSYTGETIEDWSNIEFGFSESANALQIVREITDAAGIAPNFIVRSRNVPNACAIIERDNRRYIDFNPRFFENIKIGTNTNWSVYSVLAHEIGHHVNGHTLNVDKTRHQAELEADSYSGFILYLLGAKLEEAKLCIDLISSDFDTPTHPRKSKRIVAIEEGWNDAKEKYKKSDQSSRNEDDFKDITGDIQPVTEESLGDYVTFKKYYDDYFKYGTVTTFFRKYQATNHYNKPLLVTIYVPVGYCKNCDKDKFVKISEEKRSAIIPANSSFNFLIKAEIDYQTIMQNACGAISGYYYTVERE